MPGLRRIRPLIEAGAARFHSRHPVPVWLAGVPRLSNSQTS
jgi:hypothetical protein